MDRAIVFSTLLLVGLTWLLYKLAVLLEPRGDKPVQAPAPTSSNRQKLIHERLRK
jgi:hypothetical protein